MNLGAPIFLADDDSESGVMNRCRCYGSVPPRRHRHSARQLPAALARRIMRRTLNCLALLAGILLVVQLTDSASASPGVTVSGIVFEDANANGQRDNGEQGIPGFQVHIYRASELGFPSNSVTTDASGRFNLSLPFDARVAQSVRLLIVADPSATPSGHAWRTTARSAPDSVVAEAIDVSPLTDGSVFEIAFGKHLEFGSPAPTPHVSGRISSDELLRNTPPPKPGGAIEPAGSALPIRLPSTGEHGVNHRTTGSGPRFAGLALMVAGLITMVRFRPS
jgi:hypothetical protein